MIRVMMSVFALSLLVVPRLLPAVEVTGLYEAEVPVMDQRAAARGAAARAALAEVLAKVTGDAGGGRRPPRPRMPPRRPPFQPLLQQAEQWEQRYQYRATPGEPTAQSLVASFDREAVNQRIYEAGLPVWGSNRPQILLWLAVEDGGGRTLVGGDQRPDLQALVSEQARRHGLPISLPLLDLQDQNAASLGDVWGQFTEPVLRASERYQDDGVLLARIYATGPNRWRGHWTLRHAGSNSSWESGEGSIADVVAAGLDDEAGNLAKRYALVLAPGVGDTATLVVDKVTKLQDYARVSRYLNSLDAVGAVAVEGVEGDTVMYRLRFRGDVPSCDGASTLPNPSKRVKPCTSPTMGNTLQYRLMP